MEGLGAEFQWNLAARAASKRSNCKGPPGLPCAVTPQGTWPPYIPSNPSTIMTILRTSVCPVVNNHRLGQKRTSGRHVLGGQLHCGPKIDPRLVANKINLSALDISPGQLTCSLSPTSAPCCPCANNPSAAGINTRTNVPYEVTPVTMASNVSPILLLIATAAIRFGISRSSFAGTARDGAYRTSFRICV